MKTDSSRVNFAEISSQLRDKYEDSEFDFEVNEILDEVIVAVEKSLDEKESNWKKANLSLGDKSRDSVHRWKEKIQFLPHYLSDETRAEIKKIDAEADDIIKDGKIEDVVFYFDKLDAIEKTECLKKLESLL